MVLYRDEMFRLGNRYLGILALELLIYVIYTIKIVHKFKRELSKFSVIIIGSIFLALLFKTLLYVWLRLVIGDEPVGDESAD